MKPVCLVIGAGAGIGGNVGKRFAQGGYHAVLCRRTDQKGLNGLVASIESDGGSASGFLLNAIDAGSIEERVAAVEAAIGPIEVVVFNLGAQIGDRALKDTSYKAFEMGWRLATFGLFRVASAVCPLMAERGKGTILVTSATAAMRGNKGQHRARERRSALACGRHGWTAYALPVAECGIRAEGHSHRPYRHRWFGGCAGYLRQNAWTRAVPAAQGKPRHGP